MERVVRFVLLLVMALPFVSADAQVFKMYYASEVVDKASGTVIAYDRTDSISIVVTSTDVTLSSSAWGDIKMSRYIKFSESNLYPDRVIYTCKDVGPYGTSTGLPSFTYTKSSACNAWNVKENVFEVSNGKKTFVLKSGVVLFKTLSKSVVEAYSPIKNLQSCDIYSDPLIQIMKALNCSEMQKVPVKSTVTLNGYIYKWNDYYKSSSETENGWLRVENGNNHYIAVSHWHDLTNLSANCKENTNWSTRKDAIGINYPDWFKISSGDEVIYWVEYGTDRRYNSREIVVFTYNPSTGQLQCLRLYRNSFGGPVKNNVYYFRTNDTAEWPKIKALLMQELPYCGTRIQ